MLHSIYFLVHIFSFVRMKFQFVFLLCVSGIHSANILMIQPLPTYNFFNLIFRLVKELADRQHQITFISQFPNNDLEKNYEFIFVKESFDQMKGYWKKLVDFKNVGTIGRTLNDFDRGLELTELVLKNSEVQKLLNSARHYDLVIVEHSFNEAAIGMGFHFNAPVVVLAPSGLNFRFYHLVGAPAPSSYVLDAFSVQTQLDTFWDRLNNFITSNFLEFLRTAMHLPKQNQIFQKYFKTKVDLDTIMYNVSLILSNSHSTVYDAVPYVPSVINIGGYHVKPPNGLPENLKNYLDNARNGVILFSMGSSMKSKDMDPKIHKLFFNVFSKLNENVIWKFERDLDNIPKNVKTFQWLPQQEVLAHPNVRAFITHGGLSSLIEAVYFGVPVVGLPSFSDQESNMAVAVTRGYGVRVDMKDITEDNLYKALQEILNEQKYKHNAIKMSKLMHDQPMKPIDSAIYWIEYVIRHRGAPYLRSPALDLAWYQREMVDILFFLMMVAAVLFITILIVIRKLLKLVCKGNVKKVMKSDKKSK